VKPPSICCSEKYGRKGIRAGDSESALRLALATRSPSSGESQSRPWEGRRKKWNTLCGFLDVLGRTFRKMRARNSNVVWRFQYCYNAQPVNMDSKQASISMNVGGEFACVSAKKFRETLAEVRSNFMRIWFRVVCL